MKRALIHFCSLLFFALNFFAPNGPVSVIEETAPGSGVYFGQPTMTYQAQSAQANGIQPQFFNCDFDEGDYVTYASADFVERPVESSYDDSDTFYNLMSCRMNLDTARFGKARASIHPYPAGAVPNTKEMLQFAGWTTTPVTIGGFPITLTV